MNDVLLAVDLGATSGRVIQGVVSEHSIQYETVHRFPNAPVHDGDNLRWDAKGLFDHILEGFRIASVKANEVASVGVDSWAVDYGLLRGGTLLADPFHYRDSRTERGVSTIHEQISFEALFELNGLQFLPINTIYQLATEDWNSLGGEADQILLIPDLMAYWLTGVSGSELTNASTTGLLQVGANQWSDELIALTGAPRHLFSDLLETGVTIGGMRGEAAKILGNVPLVAVASHDTASAVAATPLRSENSAYISLGTWALVGVEVEAPILGAEARAANFTNERGVDGRVRFLRNVMGMWILNECVDAWAKSGRSFSFLELVRRAEGLPQPAQLIDVNDQTFMAPGDMPEKISQWLELHGAQVPDHPHEVVNLLLWSLAKAYSETAHQAAELSGNELREINVVGGGSQNSVLCQRISTMAGVDVVAGPVEATAIGNLLLQARPLGHIRGDIDSIRKKLANQMMVERFSPAAR